MSEQLRGSIDVADPRVRLHRAGGSARARGRLSRVVILVSVLVAISRRRTCGTTSELRARLLMVFTRGAAINLDRLIPDLERGST